MTKLHGIISDRLRAMFKPGDKGWNPSRDAPPAKPLPKGVTGHQLGKKGRKAK